MLSYLKLLFERLHSKIFSPEFADKLTWFIYNKIKKRIDRFILLHFRLPILRSILDSIWVVIEPCFYYIILYYDLSIIIALISFVVSLKRYELKFDPIMYLNNRIPKMPFPHEVEKARNIVTTQHKYIKDIGDLNKIKDHNFNFKKDPISEKCSNIDQLLAEHSNNPEANQVGISAVFIKPDHIADRESLSYKYNALTEAAKISIEGQKDRLLRVLGSEQFSEEQKSTFIHEICDDIIKTKVKCSEAINNIREKRSVFIHEMDERLTTSDRNQRRLLIDQEYKDIYYLYKVEQQGIAQRIRTSTQTTWDNDNGQGPSRRSPNIR